MTKEPVQPLDQSSLVRYYWEEWKYRHETFWRLVNLWGGGIVFLLLVPFSTVTNVSEFGKRVVIFPLLAIIVSLLASWNLGAEYARLSSVGSKYRALVPVPSINDPVKKLPIGDLIVRLFGFGFPFLALVDMIILLWQ